MLLARYQRNAPRLPITQVLQPDSRLTVNLPIGINTEPGRTHLEIEALERDRQDDKINWVTAIFMGAFHVGAIAALFFFTWKAFFVACFLWWVSGSLGIGMGYHRLLTHRGYKTPKWVEYFLTVCATLALEGGPIFWVATHRIHHQFSDKEGDPQKVGRSEGVGHSREDAAAYRLVWIIPLHWPLKSIADADDVENTGR